MIWPKQSGGGNNFKSTKGAKSGSKSVKPKVKSKKKRLLQVKKDVVLKQNLRRAKEKNRKTPTKCHEKRW
jgi:hypothetical protein